MDKTIELITGNRKIADILIDCFEMVFIVEDTKSISRIMNKQGFFERKGIRTISVFGKTSTGCSEG